MGCKGSRQPPAPEGYAVGKRYKVHRPLELFDSESPEANRIETLKAKKDVVLLVKISEQSGRRKGFVIPQPAESHEAGWISLEDVQRGKAMQPPLYHNELPGSWDLKARYSVQNPATLRAGPALDSENIGELQAGCEVLLLDFGVTSGGSQSTKARLRTLVFAGDKIGWMSPETGVGDHLLKPVNLLSRKVDIHKQTLRQSGSGLRKSYQPGGNSPWEAGATYRMLERAPMRSAADLSSSEVGKVSEGSLVEVQEMNNVEIQGGWCPVACIVVQEGPEKGKSGWVRCSAKDGHDLMDTRDHNEYDKILRQMRQNISPADIPADARPAEIQELNVKLERERKEAKAREEEEQAKIIPPEDTDTQILQEQEPPIPVREPSQEMKSSADQIVAEFAELKETMQKLEDFELRQDDRPQPEPRVDVTDRSSECLWCSCGK